MKGRFYEHLVRVLVFSGSKLSCAELSTSQHDDFNNYCIDCYKCTFRYQNNDRSFPFDWYLVPVREPFLLLYHILCYYCDSISGK
jgi:hypothetical protein